MIIPLSFTFAVGKTVSIRITDVTDPTDPSVVRAYSSTGVVAVAIDASDSRYYLSYDFTDDGLYQVDAYDDDGNQSPGIVVDRTMGGVARLQEIDDLDNSLSATYIEYLVSLFGYQTAIVNSGLNPITTTTFRISWDSYDVLDLKGYSIIFLNTATNSKVVRKIDTFVFDGDLGGLNLSATITIDEALPSSPVNGDGLILAVLTSTTNAISQQYIADAGKLAPSAGDPAAGSVYHHLTSIGTLATAIVARIGAFTGTGVNTILGFFRALMRKDVGITTPSDVGGTFTHTTDSNEAIKDAVDLIEGGSGGGATAEEIDEYLSGIHGAGSWQAGTPYIINIDAQITEYDEFTEKIKIYTGTNPSLVFTVTDDGDPVDLTGKTVYLIVKKDDKTLLANAIINKVGVVSGDDNNIVTVSLSKAETDALTGKEGKYRGQLDIGPDQSVTPKFEVIIERKLRQ